MPVLPTRKISYRSGEDGVLFDLGGRCRIATVPAAPGSTRGKSVSSTISGISLPLGIKKRRMKPKTLIYCLPRAPNIEFSCRAESVAHLEVIPDVANSESR